MAKRKPLGAAAGSRRIPDSAQVQDLVSKVHGDGAGEGSLKAVQPAPRKEKVPVTKLTAMVDKTLFKRMKVHCAEEEITIKEFLESAIEAQLGSV